MEKEKTNIEVLKNLGDSIITKWNALQKGNPSETIFWDCLDELRRSLRDFFMGLQNIDRKTRFEISTLRNEILNISELIG